MKREKAKKIAVQYCTIVSIPQEYIRNNEKKIRKGRTIRLEKVVFPQKRKFSELESDDLAIDAKKSLENDAVKEYTEMYCPFVRGKSNVR